MGLKATARWSRRATTGGEGQRIGMASIPPPPDTVAPTAPTSLTGPIRRSTTGRLVNLGMAVGSPTMSAWWLPPVSRATKSGAYDSTRALPAVNSYSEHVLCDETRDHDALSVIARSLAVTRVRGRLRCPQCPGEYAASDAWLDVEPVLRHERSLPGNQEHGRDWACGDNRDGRVGDGHDESQCSCPDRRRHGLACRGCRLR